MTLKQDIAHLRKLAKKLNNGTLTNNFAKAIANKGVDIANDEYTQTNMASYTAKISCEAISSGDSSTKVLASDKNRSPKIAYLEFGTGFYAKGKYQGELPTQTISFYSGGGLQTTNGWEYYYPNSKTKATYNGVKGWFYKTGKDTYAFDYGIEPYSCMYNTSQRLREQIADICRQEVKNTI